MVMREADLIIALGAIVARELARLGFKVTKGLAKTGVVGTLSNGTSGRSIGIRADMDALPIHETTNLPYASKYPGKMHACGHDGHTAMLLAAAKHLATHRNFDGTVYLVFQPAEEGGGGAREMIKDGLFEKFPMEAIFGAHNWPGMPVGKFGAMPGPVSETAKASVSANSANRHAVIGGDLGPVRRARTPASRFAPTHSS